jgi:uncharacterized protein involved in exopolysaccharide biosynthesis
VSSEARGDATGRVDLSTASGVSNIRLLREVKYNEVMFELLAKLYEMARIDEAKEGPIIQVLDGAAPPERKSGPKRALIVLSAFFAALFGATFYALAKHALDTARGEPARLSKLTILRSTWLARKP